MAAFWQFLLLGFGIAPGCALIAQSAVMVFRGSGVVNFAASAFAAIGAYGYYIIRTAGAPTWVALVGVLLIGAACGATTYQVVIRRLGTAAPLVRVIATLGVSIVIVQALALHYGLTEENILPIFGGKTVAIFGANIDTYRLVLFGGSVALTATLSAVYGLTSFGLRTSAVAENSRSAAALGIIPERVAVVNWSLGGTIAALGGALIAPLIGLTVSNLSLLLVPALAAALLGAFRSFWLTMLGATIVGIGESLLTHYNLGPGWSQAFPFILVGVAVVLRGSSLPSRSFSSERLPAIGSGRIRPGLIACGLVPVCVATAFLHSAGAGAIATSAAIGIIMLSVVLVAGYTGQVSLAQLGLAGLGAFFAARASTDIGTGFWLSLLIGVAITLPVGVVVGLPALRSRGVNLAIVTLGLGLFIQMVIIGNDNFTGGYSGLTVGQPTVFGFALDFTDHPTRYAILTLLFFTIGAIVVANLRRGRVGRQLVAVRGNERAAAALGINLTLTKLYAFLVGAGLAAVGGVLLAFMNPVVLLQGLPFDVNSSINLLGFVVMGGIGFLGGSIFGAIIATGGVFAWVLSLWLGGDATNWLELVAGVGTVVTVLLQPDGVAGKMAEDFKARFSGLRASPSQRHVQASEEGEPAGRREMATLQVNDLSVRFGPVAALSDVSLSLRSGEILGVIGPNGAGKTTLIDAVTGVNRRYDGQILLNGQSLDGLSASYRARRGIARSFQSLELFEDLSVEDNLRVAADRPRAVNYLSDLLRPGVQPLPSPAAAAVHEFALSEHLSARPSQLPFGLRRLVGIARAVAGVPRILLLDEPAAGLDDHESRELAVMLRRLARDWGFAILLIEHDMNLVMSVCDRLVALDFGRAIAVGSPDNVRHDPAVVRAYIGSSEPEPTGEPAS